MCKPGWQTGSLGSVYFIGFVLTLLWLPRFGDIYGRIMPLKYEVIVQSILFTVLMFTKNFYVMLATIFFFGLFSSIRLIIGFVYYLELMPENTWTALASAYSIIDGLTYMIILVYFWVISTHWVYLISVAYVL